MEHRLFKITNSELEEGFLKIDKRYFPASPVQTSLVPGSAITNGAAEAFIELQKSLNVVGDYRLSSSTNASNWGIQNSGGQLQEYDYLSAFTTFGANGVPGTFPMETLSNAFCGPISSSTFAMSTDLETSNGIEISGLNAEEQSDISLLANWQSPQVTGSTGVPSSIEVYTYYDAMIVLRENNVLELIQ